MAREVAGIYRDIEKFCDFVSPLLVTEEMVASGFDLVFETISVQIRLTPRVFEAGRAPLSTNDNDFIHPRLNDGIWN